MRQNRASFARRTRVVTSGPFHTLIGATALATITANAASSTIVIDCRANLADPAAGRAAYLAGHIPGAVHADLADDLSSPHLPDRTGRHPLPDPEQLAARFRAWGVDTHSQIVAYDADSGAFAARAWWLARWLGHTRVAVLNGGLAAWRAAGGALETGPAGATRRPGNFRRATAKVRTVSAEELLTGQYTVLDARGAARYRGEVEPIDPVAGHIPGALSLPFESNLNADLTFKASTDLAAQFERLPSAPGGCAVYCGSGVTACHLVLAMCDAGLSEPALYPGSWSEWIVDPRRPVATGP